MRAKINFNGATKEFNTIKELKTFLNSALYYANDLILFSHKANVDPISYADTNDLKSLVSECNFYDDYLDVVQEF